MARILIIEDDEMMSKMVAQAIQNQGHETIQAADGDEGLRLFRENPTDVVITDIPMPEKEGIATIHELKREFPDAKIIAVSGGGFTGKDYLPEALPDRRAHSGLE